MYDDQIVMTMQQVQRALQSSRNAILQMGKRGELKPLPRDNQRAKIFFLRRDVLEWVERMKTVPEPERVEERV